MNNSQETFLDLLEGQTLSSDYLSAFDLAQLYINSALLVTVTGFLKEQLWLKRKSEENISYCDFIVPLFNGYLSRVNFLEEFLTIQGEKKLKQIGKDAGSIETLILQRITNESNEDQKQFVIESLKEMRLFFLDEERAQEGHEQSLGHRGLELYRTFDKLDVLFNLNYQLDREMEIDHSVKERLYEGAGVGVQSGYSTILLAMENIEVNSGDIIVDLGSGYGRVGLVCSLLRPDVEFIGYEYVPHRVQVSKVATRALGLEDNLSFITQDLSLPTFKIPEADVYYLYDPFTKETYDYVLDQIVELSKKRSITIVTKGNARGWLMEIAKKNSWPRPKFIDEGNLCIFKS